MTAHEEHKYEQTINGAGKHGIKYVKKNTVDSLKLINGTRKRILRLFDHFYTPVSRRAVLYD